MKIENSKTSNINKKSKLKSSSKTADNSFSKLVENTYDTTKANATADISMPKTDNLDIIGNILDEGKTKQEQAKEHGEDVLDDLKKLQLDLITGKISLTSLKNMARKLENYKLEIKDENLQNILDEIHLRAEVELAKYSIDKTE